MKLRSAVVVAGLVLAAVSGAAEAAPITYNVSFGFGGGGSIGGSFSMYSASVSGTLTTDGTSGVLHSNNIGSFDLITSVTQNGTTNTGEFTDADTILAIGGNDLSAVTNGNKSNLIFSFSGTGGSLFTLSPIASAGFALIAGNGSSSTGTIAIEAGSTSFTTNISGDSIIGTATLSTVPLPASAPMFGAALFGLAGLGYAAKRKKAAASA